MKIFFTLLTLLFYSGMNAQVTEEIIEKQVENSIRSEDEKETEDDSFLQQLQQYLRQPVNLNTATEEDLSAFQMISPMQVEQLLAYRKLLGNFIDLYELQAVPGWNIELILKIRLYVTVSLPVNLYASVIQQFKKSSSVVLFRISQVLEKSKGYLQKGDSAKNYYRGSPQKIFLRYTGAYKHFLQYGILAEKDAGEQFFKGRQKTGFDFYSAHIFIRQPGLIRTIAIGDFTVKLGQGLTEWQGLSFAGGGDAASVKRQSPVLAPYHSAGEAGFHRGIGLTIGRKRWEMSFFGSYRQTDGNLVKDTLADGEYISSLQGSGYHRTSAEAADKGVQRQLAFGGRAAVTLRKLKLGINGVSYSFRVPLYKGEEPYEQYAIRGRSWFNGSIDYGYTLRNCHFFGELAVAKGLAKAFLGGLILGLSASADLSLVYRYIEPAYQSVNGNAFTRSAAPSNENGLYIGLILRPGTAWRIDASADLFRYPWLRYRTAAPSQGTEYRVQLSYKPNKTTELYGLYRYSNQSLNVVPDQQQAMTAVGRSARQGLRIHLNTKPFSGIIFRGRAELLWTRLPGEKHGSGALFYADMIYKPLLKPIAAGARFQYFETGGYESRIYAYENDVLYGSSTAVFYDKGFMYYINMQYDVNKKITCWLRFSQTLFRGKTLIGSGLDEIPGGRKSELKFQSFYKL